MSPYSDDPLEVDWLAVDRYLAGNASDADAATVERWMAADPSHMSLIANLRATHERGKRDRPAEWRTDPMWTRLSKELHPGPRVETRRSVTRSHRWWVAPAAGLVAVGAIVAAWPWLRATSPVFGSAGRLYVTRPGERATATLPDGTQLQMGPESRVVIPTVYGVTRRDVSVEGEAYFVVRHDTTHPFVVHTRGATTEDVGTAFAVRAYAGEASVAVTVAEGAVRMVASRTRAVELHPGDMGVVDDSGRMRVIHDADLQSAVAWTEGRLVFDDALAGDVLQEVARWYGIEIRVSDPSVARGRLTVSFATPSPEEAVARLALLLGGRAEWQGNKVVIVTGTTTGIRGDR